SGIATAAVDFSKDIAPLLEQRCQVCHGLKQQMKGLRLDGPLAADVPAKIIDRVTSAKSGYRMPPVGAALNEKEVAALRAWIGEGAKWPAGYKPGERPMLWSFRPIAKPAAPAVKNKAWVRNDIDAFVLARLEKEGIAASPEASKATLLRRLSLDLTGLPPTPEEITIFSGDVRPNAYERAVDRLLASPHYGEKWAR